PGARAIAAWRTPDVYYTKSGALYATNLETKEVRKVAEARGTVVNADETLVIGAVYDAEAGAKVKELGLPMLVTAELAPRDEPPGRLKPGGRALALVVTDIQTGGRQEDSLLDRMAQPPASVAGRPPALALLSRRRLASGGPRLDHSHGRQGAPAHAQA